MIVAVQVVDFSINWYFWAHEGDQDLYSQEWRDKLYDAAAECHTHVDRGCGLYYRGSNAYHLKVMHNKEAESLRNHNHYRMQENQPVTPVDFRQHMQAFKAPKHAAVLAEFFESPAEVDDICDGFDSFYLNWTRKEDEKSLSPAEEYTQSPSRKLSQEDILEFQLFGAQQEPCRLSVDELSVDYEAARRHIQMSIQSLQKKDPTAADKAAIDALVASIEKVDSEYNALLDYRKKGGSRGLGSDRAWTRQLSGSSLKTFPLPQGVGRDAPVIPEWAVSLRKAVDNAVTKFIGPKRDLELNPLNEEELMNLGIKTSVSTSTPSRSEPRAVKTPSDRDEGSLGASSVDSYSDKSTASQSPTDVSSETGKKKTSSYKDELKQVKEKPDSDDAQTKTKPKW